MSEFDTYTTPGDRKVANRLLRALLANGCAVSVYDGEEWTLKRSADAAAIRAALASTGEDTLRWRDADGAPLGSFYLVWGNDPSGEELISDHTDNEACTAVWRYVHGQATMTTPAWVGEA